MQRGSHKTPAFADLRRPLVGAQKASGLMPWRCLRLLLILAGLLLPWEAQGQTGSALPFAPGSNTERVRVLTQRVRALPQRGAPSLACADLQLADLKMSLRGVDVEPSRQVAFERMGLGERSAQAIWAQPRLHGILLDTSGSLLGDLDAIRSATLEHLAQLQLGDDQAMVLTFDESVVMVQPPTSDLEQISSSMDQIRLGGMTSLYDGLFYTRIAFQGRAVRPVVVLVTDGVDSSSAAEHHEMVRSLQEWGDVSLFVIGWKMPDIRAGRPGGSARNRLSELARYGKGRLYDVSSVSELARTFRSIRRYLDAEAQVSVLDDRPTESIPRLKIRSRRQGCHVHLLQPKQERIATERLVDSISGVMDAGHLVAEPYRLAPHRVLDGGCHVAPLRRARKGDPLPQHTLQYGAGEVAGCVLDWVSRGGVLHDADNVERVSTRSAAQQDWRTVRFAEPSGLAAGRPNRSLILEQLSEQVQGIPAESTWVDPFKRPTERHARSHRDHPGVVEGSVLLDLQPLLASSLAQSESISDWSRQHEGIRVEQERAQALERFRRRWPDAPAAQLEQAILSSERAGEWRRRAESPNPEDLQARLGVWLGDVSAATLFNEWEALEARRYLARAARAGESHRAPGEFERRWVSLFPYFRLPSYNRILGALVPSLNREQDRLGFWRIILPRPSWFLPRKKGYKRHPEWTDLPLDLVPDQPYLVGFLQRWEVEKPREFKRLAEHLDLTELRYRLIGKPYTWNPEAAFRRFEIVLKTRLELAVGAMPREISLVFDYLEDDPAEQRRHERSLRQQLLAAAGIPELRLTQPRD